MPLCWVLAVQARRALSRKSAVNTPRYATIADESSTSPGDAHVVESVQSLKQLSGGSEAGGAESVALRLLNRVSVGSESVVTESVDWVSVVTESVELRHTIAEDSSTSPVEAI
eukprot:1832406-Rhodomonas_salina.2